MQLAHYLTPQGIVDPLSATTKREVLAELVTALAARLGQPEMRDQWLAAVLERESSASTFLPTGVAVPHARVAGIDELAMVMGIAPKPIDDQNTEFGLQASVFCLFLSPLEETHFGRHLKWLAHISAVFSDPTLVQELMHIRDPQEVFLRLQKRERVLEHHA